MPKHARFKPKYAPGQGLWVLNIPVSLSETGKRQRRFFPNRKEAFQVAQQIREASEKFGSTLLKLSPAHLAEASEVYRLLNASGRPYSLISICRGWLHQQEQDDTSVTLKQLFQEYLDTR